MRLGIGSCNYKMRDLGVTISSPQKAFIQCASAARKSSKELGTIWEGIKGDAKGSFCTV